MTTKGIALGTSPETGTFRLGLGDWLTGMHVIGSPGTGKSKFLEFIIRQIIMAGWGILLLDPHGPIFAGTLAFLARYRLHRPIYLLNLSDQTTTRIFGFNPFLRGAGDTSTRVQRTVTAILKSLSITNPDLAPRLVRWLKNTVTLMMERGDLTIADLPLLFTFANAHIRAYLSHGTSVADEWLELNGRRMVTQFQDEIGSTKNRLDVLSTATTTRRFLSITEPASNLNLPKAMAEAAIVLCDAHPSSVLDPRNQATFGTLLLSEVFDCARQRPVTGGRPPIPFFTVVDEIQNFLFPDLPEMFAQGRKYLSPLVVAHQFIDQLRAEDVRFWSAVNGAALTKVCFRINSAKDAIELADELFADVDLREVKFTNWRTGFRPVPTREQSFTRTRGGGTETSTGTSVTQGHESRTSDAESDGETSADEAHTARTATHTHGESKEEAVTTTEGKILAVGTTSTHQSGFSSAVARDAEGPGGEATDTYSEQEVEVASATRTKSEATAKMKEKGSTDSDSLAETEGSGHHKGTTHQIAHTESEADSETFGRTRSRSRKKSWSAAVTDQPGTKYEEYREPSHELFSRDDQLHRLAATLRLQPKRVIAVRTPHGMVHELKIPDVEPIALSAERIAAFQEEIETRIGALPVEEVDRRIAASRAFIEEQAQKFAGRDHTTVDLEVTPVPYDRAPRRADGRPIRPSPVLNPASKPTPPTRSGGTEG